MFTFTDTETGPYDLVFTPPTKMLGRWIFGAGPVFEFASRAGDQLADPSGYIRAVLGDVR